jgi:hypothetical protein
MAILPAGFVAGGARTGFTAGAAWAFLAGGAGGVGRRAVFVAGSA